MNQTYNPNMMNQLTKMIVGEKKRKMKTDRLAKGLGIYERTRKEF